MATQYIPAYKGYITDVPELWFKRNDKKIFHYDQLTAASMSPQVNFTEVNAGWSMFPVAYLPGQSTMEMQATSGQFNADLFAMANGQKFEVLEGGYMVPYTAMYQINMGKHTVEIKTPESVKDSVVIDGLVLDLESSPQPGEYSVSETSSGEGAEKYVTTITFGDIDLEEVEITYFLNDKTAKMINITNKSTAVGELIAKWPVYATGDEQAAAGVKGYVLMKIYKCRITAMPGFDTSYKSAATNSVTFSALDAKRADDATYSIAYIEKA